MSLRRNVAFAIGLWCMTGVPADVAGATPFEGTGHAPIDADAARDVAVARARRSALESALSTIDIDQRKREQLLEHAPVWTRAYRVLGETDDGATVTVKLEVDIDVQRVGKHIDPDAGGKSGLVLGKVTAGDGCGPGRELVRSVEDDLVRQGAVGRAGKGVRVDVSVRCAALGQVSNSHLRAARIGLLGRVGDRVVATATGVGFDPDPASAAAAAVHEALAELGDQLAARRRGEVAVIVRTPWPAASVRRFRQALERSVAGVTAATLAGIEPDGSARLMVRGRLDAHGLASALGGLNPAGVSLTITEISGDDAVTVELR